MIGKEDFFCTILSKTKNEISNRVDTKDYVYY